MITAETSEISYQGNGSTSTPYAVPFRFDDNSWLRVEVTDADDVVSELTLGTGFTISGTGSIASASILTVAAVPAESEVRIFRNTPLTQSTSLTANGTIPSATIERRLDQQTMGMQDLRRDLDAVPQSITQDAVDTAIAAAASAEAAKEEAQAAAEQAIGAINNQFPPGEFANDLEAYANGVAFGQLYRKPSGVAAWRQKLASGKIAFAGDSHTAFLADVPTTYYRLVYIAWLLSFLKGRMVLQPDTANNEATFATGGILVNSAQMIGHIEDVCASDADFVVVLPGTNDALSNTPTATFVQNVLDIICTPILEANKVPIILAPLPAPQQSKHGGVYVNTTWQLSDALVAYRVALEAMCEANNIPYVNPHALIETSPGRAINECFADANNENVHLSPLGAERVGRAVAAYMNEEFSFTYDPYANTGYLTGNADFSSTGATGVGSNVRPTGCNLFLSNIALTSETVVTVGGVKYWELVLGAPGAGGFGQFWLSNAMGTSPASKTVEGVVAVEVVSGRYIPTQFGIGSGTTPPTSTLQASNMDGTSTAGRGGGITSADGLIPIITPPVALGGGVTLSRPNQYFAIEGATTIRIRQGFGVREVAP